jgi:hypothetical protein
MTLHQRVEKKLPGMKKKDKTKQEREEEFKKVV